MNKLSMRLQELRQSKGVSLQKASSDLGVSNAAICKWENGVNEPKASYLYKLAQYYSVSIDYLLGLEDDFGVKSVESTSDFISEEERQFLKDYRSLNFACKKLVKQTIETLKNSTASSGSGKAEDIS